MADRLVSKTSEGNLVRVRLPLPAPDCDTSHADLRHAEPQKRGADGRHSSCDQEQPTRWKLTYFPSTLSSGWLLNACTIRPSTRSFLYCPISRLRPARWLNSGGTSAEQRRRKQTDKTWFSSGPFLLWSGFATFSLASPDVRQRSDFCSGFDSNNWPLAHPDFIVGIRSGTFFFPACLGAEFSVFAFKIN